MRIATNRLFLLALFAFVSIAGSSLATDDALDVRLEPTAVGIDQVFRRCFAQLRESGHAPDRMPAKEMSACMRPEIEAMAEFAYEVATAYPVSSLTRIALEACTIEQSNALTAPQDPAEKRDTTKLTFRWLTDCLKEVRWLDHDEQTQRLKRAQRAQRAME